MMQMENLEFYWLMDAYAKFIISAHDQSLQRCYIRGILILDCDWKDVQSGDVKGNHMISKRYSTTTTPSITLKGWKLTWYVF